MSDADERCRRTGTSVEKPYELPGTGIGSWMPWEGHADKERDDEDNHSDDSPPSVVLIDGESPW